jgi:hypothetical protein
MVSLLRRLRFLILLAGLAVSVLAVLGLGLGWGDSTTRVAGAVPPPSASPTAQPTIPESLTPSSSRVPPAQQEKPAAFFARFEDAVRSGDAGFLAGRLHPDVIKRYGRAQCRRFVADLADATAKLRLVRVTGPQVYAYASDGMTASVPDTFVFHATGTAAGTKGPRDYHFALVAGKFRSFSDCGTPKR